MTHESEKSFAEKVGDYLKRLYGDDNVEEQKYLSESARYVDYWVSGPFVDMAIEVENDFESVFTGDGQAIMYAGHGDNVVPVVVVPEGHVQNPEAEYMSRFVAIVEFSE